MKSIVCRNCGATFESDNPKRKYCSPECSQKAQRKRITVSCKKCGKPFEVRPSEIRQGRGAYCSTDCLHSTLSKGNENKTKICRKCGRETVVGYRVREKEKTHICRICQQKKNTRLVSRCALCGKTFQAKTAGGNSMERCCSIKCRRLFLSWGGRVKNRCSLCGDILTKKTKTHAQTWAVCDVCAYLKKKAYKIKPKIDTGGDPNIHYKIAMIDAINHTTKKGKSKWERQGKSLQRAAKRLQLTT
jgi:transcription elongation factor Elf1